jgi:hypothetical protein
MLDAYAGAMLMLTFFNYADGNHDTIREMMTHPAGVLGLSDGGAHCGLICDASYPTFLLTHWARDRHRGPKLALEYNIVSATYVSAEPTAASASDNTSKRKSVERSGIDVGQNALSQHRLSSSVSSFPATR